VLDVTCRDIKELNSSQARISVETAREVANDKTLKTKNDKDRKLREKKQNNTKKFMDERKVAKMRQDKERERLRKKHEKQLDELNKTFHNVRTKYKIDFELNLYVFR
jgi:phosphatidylinositol phospholipase C, beta